VSATVQICRDKEEGGPKALLKGFGPTVLGYGMEGARKFGCYEISKSIVLALLGDTPIKSWRFVAQALLLVPLLRYYWCQ